MLRTSLVVVALLGIGLAAQFFVLGALQHRSAQVRRYAELRHGLAAGTVPVGQTTASNRLVPLGTPIALIEIPAVHVREVVGEGTTAGSLMDGPGHLRSTPLPGQPGTSVIFGRQAAYGGPFGNLDRLRKGAKIVVTTGQGRATFHVIGIRRAGDPQPVALAADAGRLQLVTADGTPFSPHGVLRVDADLESKPFDSSALRAGQVPATERPMAGDPSTAWALVLWIQAVLVVGTAAVWCWLEWGHIQTWIVFVPTITFVALAVGTQLFRLLPNLL